MLALTFTDGRVAHAESLTAFMDEHFPPGLDIDAIWTGHTADNGAVLILLPREEGHAFIALSHIEGDGLNIGAAEADRIRLGLTADPFDADGPATNTLRERFDRFLHGTGLTNLPRGAEADPSGAAAWVLPQLPPTYTTQEPQPSASTQGAARDSGSVRVSALGEDPLHALVSRGAPASAIADQVAVEFSDGHSVSAATVREAIDRHVGADVDPVWISDRGGRDVAQLGRIDEHGHFTDSGLTITGVRVAGRAVPSDELASTLWEHARGRRTPTSDALYAQDAATARLQRLTDHLGAATPAVRPAAPTPPIGRQL